MLYFSVKLMLNLLHITSPQQLRVEGKSALMNHHSFLKIGQINPYKLENYKMYPNITIQYINIRFSDNIRLSSAKFEKEIDFILSETNAYIQQFVMHSDPPLNR